MRGALKGFFLFLRRWLPVGLWGGVVLFLSTGAGSGQHTEWLLRPWLVWFWPDLAGMEWREIHHFIRKGAHVLQFFVLALLLWRAVRVPPAWKIGRPGLAVAVLAVSLVLGLASEGIQIFTPERGAGWSDVLLDLAGGALGLLLILAFDRGGRAPVASAQCRRSAPKIRSETRPSGPRLLLTSDLHLDLAGPEVLEQLHRAVATHRPDGLVVAGDLGPAARAAEWLGLLRMVWSGPLVICLGNHDHWLDHPENWSFDEVAGRWWRPACEAAGVRCLDFGNVTLNGLLLCGGYGHYDLGFRADGVEDGGRTAGLPDYQAGVFGGLRWEDSRRMPRWERSLTEEARLQAGRLAGRLGEAAADGREVLLVTHTVLFPEVNGHEDPPGTVSGFLRAYSGNSLAAAAVAPSARILAAVCGHTHRPSPVCRVRGFPCAATGSDYGRPGFLTWDPSGSLRRVVAG